MTCTLPMKKKNEEMRMRRVQKRRTYNENVILPIKQVTAVNRRATCNDTTESRKDNRDSRKGIIKCQMCKKEGHSAEIYEFRGEKNKYKNKEQKEEHNKERRIPEYNEEKQKNVQLLTQMLNVMMNLCQQKN